MGLKSIGISEMGILSSGRIKANRLIISSALPLSAAIGAWNNRDVVITFNQAMDATSIPATTAFSSAGRVATSVSILGTDVTVRFTPSFAYGEAATIAYTEPAINKLKSLLGTETDSFTGLAITNNLVFVFDSTNTPGWYDYTDDSTLTNDGGGLISSWRDKLGSGHDLAAAGAGRPTLGANGITFSNTTGANANAFNWGLPCCFYLVFTHYTHRSWYPFLSAGGPYVSTEGTAGRYVIQLNAGSRGIDNILGTLYIMRLFVNTGSAGEKWMLNQSGTTGGDYKDVAGTGLYIGGMNMLVKEIILRNKIDSASDETAIYNYLAAKYGIPTI